MSAPPKVSVRDLKKRYGSVEAARGVSFEIRDGEIFGLIGPNGAGKTTTVECVIGLREPDEGAIEVCGIDARRRPREVKEKIGAALQTTALQDKITPREALALFGAFYQRKAEPAALLDRFALLQKADAPFEALSGGQRQRLALALAFVNNPELVFLDEPTAGLDPQSRRELHGEIAQDEARRAYRAPHHALPERGRGALRSHRHHRSRPHRRHRHATRARREVERGAVRVPGTVQPLERGWLEKIPGVEGLSCEDTSARFRSPSVRVTVAEVMKNSRGGASRSRSCTSARRHSRTCSWS